MGKVIKTGLMIVAAVVLVTVVAPLVAGALVAAGASALVASIVSALVVAAIMAGAQMLLMPKPKALSQSMADRLQITVDPTTPRKIVFGRTAAGADERFHEKYELKAPLKKMRGDYYARIIALASHRIHRVSQVYLEDELSFNNGTTVGKFYGQSIGLLIEAVTEGSAATAKAWGTGSYWNTSAKFTGCAYLRMRHKMDEEWYPDGLPTRLTTIVEGCPVFDPRRSVAYGGSMSPTNQATWQWVVNGDEIGRNPALCLLTYIIGWRINGVLVWGMGVPVERIDLGSFITYANVCDESVLTKAGTATKRYTCDAIFSTADTHETITQAICLSMGTVKFVDTSGLYSLIGGFDDLDGPIIEFTDDDLIGAYEWKPSVPLSQRYSIARGRFANPEKLYQLEDWGEIETAPLADGIPRPLVLEMAAVSRAETCQRIAKQNLLRNAYSGAFASNFGPRGFLVQVGSLVHMTIASEGWNRKLFRVIDHAETIDLTFQMTLQEESAAIYAFDNNEASDLPDDIRPPGWSAQDAAEVEDLAATSRTIDNSTGGSDSYIDVSWTAPSRSATLIQFQTRETNGPIWVDVGTADEEAEEHSFRSVSSGIGHEIRARFRMYSGAFGPWSEPVSIVAAVGVGVTSVNGILTNENVTFAADKDGNVL